MEEKLISEKESLLLIRQMIHTAKKEQKDDGKGWIMFGWLLFGAPSLQWVAALFSNPLIGSVEQQAVALIGLSIVTVYSIPLIAMGLLERYTYQESMSRALYYSIATALIVIYLNSSTPDFIYFQF